MKRHITKSNIWARGCIRLAVIALATIGFQAHGNAAETNDSNEHVLSTANVTCSLSGGGKMKFAAIQTIGTKERLFHLTIENCRHVENPEGVHNLVVDLEISLNPESDISLCSGFSAALLFRLNSTTSSFSWKGATRVIKDIPVYNHEGDTRNLEYFGFYSGGATQKKLGAMVFPDRSTPDFREYYWGQVLLLSPFASGEFDTALHDYLTKSRNLSNTLASIAVQATLYRPRAWCLNPTRGDDEPAKYDLKFARE